MADMDTQTDTPKLDVAETFDTTSSLSVGDVETGAAVLDLNQISNQNAEAARRSNRPNQGCGSKSRIGWILLIGVVIVITFFVGLSVGRTSNNNNSNIQASVEVGTAEEPANHSAFPDTSNNDSADNLVQIDVNLTSESEEPTTEPTSEPSSKPSLAPTKAPTSTPTSSPSNSPTMKPSSSPTNSPTTGSPTLSPTLPNPYYFGDEFVTVEDLGIEMSRGLTVRLISRAGEKVQYANGEESESNWHDDADAAGIVPLDPLNPLEGGYVYMSNSETDKGGVHGLYFDQFGNILQYKELLSGTSDNCGGGLTPWNTWVSCEEHDDGQCWQVDPMNERDAEVTELGGSDGGRYESVAVDNRDPEKPVFFTTEDDEKGAMRRFVANGNGWDALHSEGKTTFLNILDDEQFEWTDDKDKGRKSAKKYYPSTEGIQVHEGKVYFMSKELESMIILDLENRTYETEVTGKKFYGEGSFGDSPDQNLFGPTRKYIYFTEDGGSSPGVYARYGDTDDAKYFTIFQAIPDGMHADDETSGIALSPDHRRMYACIQHNGYCFEFMREDMLPFE